MDPPIRISPVTTDTSSTGSSSHSNKSSPEEEIVSYTMRRTRPTTQAEPEIDEQGIANMQRLVPSNSLESLLELDLTRLSIDGAPSTSIAPQEHYDYVPSVESPPAPSPRVSDSELEIYSDNDGADIGTGSKRKQRPDNKLETSSNSDGPNTDTRRKRRRSSGSKLDERSSSLDTEREISSDSDGADKGAGTKRRWSSDSELEVSSSRDGDPIGTRRKRTRRTRPGTVSKHKGESSTAGTDTKQKGQSSTAGTDTKQQGQSSRATDG